MNAPPEERRRDLDRLQAQIATRPSIQHLAHAAVATVFWLIAFTCAGILKWGEHVSENRGLAPVVASAGMVMLVYTLVRSVLGRRAHVREQRIFTELKSLRRELKLEDASAQLPE